MVAGVSGLQDSTVRTANPTSDLVEMIYISDFLTLKLCGLLIQCMCALAVSHCVLITVIKMNIHY